MPKVRPVKSLLQTSLDLIARMMVVDDRDEDDRDEDDRDEDDRDEDDREEESTARVDNSVYKCVSNPFHALPSAYLLQIVDTLTNLCVCERQSVAIKYFTLLITPQTRKINLSILNCEEHDVVYQLLQLAADHCPQLTDLMMEGVKMPRQFYHTFLPHFKHLEVLNVARPYYITFDDSCMEILGHHCQNLRKLNVNMCCYVTDAGIDSLCGQCKYIEELEILSTRVTKKGVQRALENFSHLKILRHDEVICALAEMQHYLIPTKCALTQLEFGLTYGCLRLVAPSCPLVTRLEIGYLANLTNSELVQGLMALESLSKLIINTDWCDHSRNITFDGGLMPFLKTKGSWLKSLQIQNVGLVVRLDVVVDCCPNLTFLSLNSKYSAEQETNGFLNHLKKLRMGNTFYRFHQPPIEPPINYLLLKVSPVTLKKLAIEDCHYLTSDSILRHFFQMNSFVGLEQLEFFCCNFVTKNDIDLFMTEENALKRLGIYHCESVSEEDIQDWKRNVRNLNWDLDIQDKRVEWSQFGWSSRY